MISTPDGRAPDAKTMAAIMAAVQAYIAGEARDTLPSRPSAISAWKTAPWGVLRGGAPRRALSWRHGG